MIVSKIMVSITQLLVAMSNLLGVLSKSNKIKQIFITIKHKYHNFIIKDE